MAGRNTSDLSENVGVAAFSLSYVAAVVFNEIGQQAKHAYYHLSGTPHKRVERGEVDPDAFFDMLKMYVQE
ncbi:MAG: hypothetical protein H6502_04240 [Candidatus Woesearchaeota archaeon]|nr:MAG: hypothetical protein H6502_04240 [Candidatus Woesearchaeota archaeon]